mmetsp:Transcript_22154/g.41265  ORF Transcript_22154/g.41265 Transcript_22154/m.41265 type:complete len:109 (+) Transcript_22154:254-580(+)
MRKSEIQRFWSSRERWGSAKNRIEHEAMRNYRIREQRQRKGTRKQKRWSGKKKETASWNFWVSPSTILDVLMTLFEFGITCFKAAIILLKVKKLYLVAFSQSRPKMPL